MSNIISEIVFPGAGLNADDDLKWIPLGDAPYRLNILVSADGAQGVLTNFLGNTRTVDIADHQLNLSHTYVTIGSFYNRLTRKCYYFVFSQPYDSGGGAYIYDNKLFQYSEDTQLLDLIFTDTKNFFGLELTYPMKDPTMLGDWLYFNPRMSEPKMIDVVRAYNYTNYPLYALSNHFIYGQIVTFAGGLFRANTAIPINNSPSISPAMWDRIGDAYRNETEIGFESEFNYAFNVIKMPPTVRPRLAYATDSHIQSNNVRGIMFRFSYRYKYYDNSYSVYSAYSDISLPENDEAYNGEILGDTSEKNYINITVGLHSPALVKEVEIVFQETGSIWKRAKIINRQEQGLLSTFGFTYPFYNNESYVLIPDIDVAKIYDSVPKRANSQEIINKNILTYGGCLEGFNNLDKDEIRVTLTPEIHSFETPTVEGITIRNNITNGDITYLIVDEVYYTAKINIANWFYLTPPHNGDQYIITLDGTTNSHVFTTPEVASASAVCNALVTIMGVNYGLYDVTTDGSNLIITGSSYQPVYPNITKSLFCEVGNVLAELTKKRGFKTGANHPFCIFYYDANLRRWDAQTSKENKSGFGLEVEGTTVYVPMFNEVGPPPADTANRWTIAWEIFHLPPPGAKYWKWGYAGNTLCSYFVQYIIAEIDTVGNMNLFNITPLQTIKDNELSASQWNEYPQSIIDPYEWQKGDRVRFITEETNPVVGGTRLGDLLDGVYDYEIVKIETQDASAPYTIDQTWIYTQSFSPSTYNIGVNTLVEIYRPLKRVADTRLDYFEFGEMMNIIEDSAGVMVHGGITQDQDTAISQTATGTFDSGDIYHILRTPDKPLDTTDPTVGVFHESMWYSDFYFSADFDKGKLGFETTFNERFLNIIRYSNQYIANTLINGLSTFEGDHFKEVNDIYGNIVGIYEQGDTLKVYQERKPSSILIGRQEYMGADGNVTVAVSNTILGAIRYSPSNYSTVFPESLSRNNRYIYGFDIYNGVVWRDSVNGLFPISGRYAEAGVDADYKMQTYFKLKSKALLEGGIQYIDVLTGWDEEYKCLFVVFRDSVHHENNETIVFHEPSNRWICFASFEQSSDYIKNVLGGYNTPLEPDYEVIKGFEGGIGFVFNEETRFAEFHFTTPNDPESMYPNDTLIVNEDNTTFVIEDTTLAYLIQ